MIHAKKYLFENVGYPCTIESSPKKGYCLIELALKEGLKLKKKFLRSGRIIIEEKSGKNISDILAEPLNAEDTD